MLVANIKKRKATKTSEKTRINVPHYVNTYTIHCDFFSAAKMTIINSNFLYIFPYFCSKHRLLVHVRTASLRWF